MNQYKLCIWPEHCLIESWGHNVNGAIQKELQDWGRRNLKQVHYVMKGQNAKTEMYSVIKAEVPVESDAATSSNGALLARLSGAGEVCSN